MLLKRVEMVGFKSFADKAVMELDRGVVTIVGPNGCGKSNVADALRWVFGEQNPRLLRGNQMEDVIFNGTDQRKAIGRAEVSVTFEGCEGILPTEYHEVTITRRLFRSGESQYLINQSPCLLRDIRELFMGTGIGTNAYFLLEQGKIDMVLSAKPEDRRNVFEEAAGIMKYKLKKKASLQRLELTEANLIRLADIVREVKRQIISLERQAGKARRYQQAREELKGLELKVARVEYESRQRELEELDSLFQKKVSQRDDFQNQAASLQEKIQEVERNHRAIFDELNSLERADFELQHKIQNAVSEVALLKERINEFEARLKSDFEEVEQAKIRLEDLKKQFVQEEENKKQFLDANRDQKNDLEARKAKLESVIAEFDKGREALDAAKGRFIDLKQQESQYKNQMMVHHHREKDLALRREKLLTEREKVENHLKDKELEREEAQKERDKVSQERIRIEENCKAYLAKRQKLEEDRERIVNEIEKEKEKNIRAAARREAAGEFLSRSQKTVKVPGTLFHSVLEVPDEYRQAIKVGLGGKSDCVLKGKRSEIVKTSDTVFFGLDTVISREGNDGCHSLGGFIGYACDLVKCTQGFENALRALLGNVVLLKDFESLKALPEKMLGRYRYVTLDGQWLDCDGTWGWGVNGHAEGSEVDWVYLENEIKSTVAKMGALETQKAPLMQELEQLNREIAAEQGRHHQKELELANVSGHVVRIEAKIKDLTDERWSLDQETGELSREIEELASTVANISTKLSEMSTEGKGISREIEEYETVIHQLESQKEKALVELAELKVMSRSLEDEERRYEKRLSELGAGMSEVERLIARRTEELAMWGAKKEESEKRIAAHEEDMARWHQERDAAQMRRQEVEQRVQEITAAMQGDREQLSELTKTLEGLREELSSAELKKAQSQMQRDNILQRIKEKYDLRLDEVPLDETVNLAEIQPRITELQDKLRQMGDVNLVAIQEFDEYRTRYDFLLKQQEDMTHAKEDLTKAIQKINTTIRELFLETFGKIQGTFNDLFRKLFGGGRAVLELLNDGDVLECGIDIAAQPPGKKLQTISLLSGGEKTLTALSLLLAIFKVRPSPFCFMDEMDAALDESNILRFLSLLDEFKSDTQFILITHNKRTVGIADVVYGVTMEESGVSKLVSIRMPSQTEDKEKVLAAG